MRTLLRASIFLALVLLSVSNAYAQTVRVVAGDAAVRLKPDPNSSVIATVQAGAILQVRSKEGFWYSVSLPAESQGVLRVGYISVTDVEVFGSSGSLTTPPANPAAGSLSQADWKARFDQIQRRRSAGKKKFWIGTIAESVGLGLLAYWSTNEVTCDRFNCYDSISYGVANAGGYLLLGGGVISTWGIFQWIFANGDLNALELEMKRSQSTTTAAPQLNATYTFSW